MRPRSVSRLGLFGIAAALVCGWLAADLFARRVRVAGELRYVVPGYQMLLATGSPERVWRAVDLQFPLIRHDPYDGPLHTTVQSVRQQLKDKGVPIGSVEDMAAAGLDVSRGAVVAWYPSGPKLAVVNASDLGRLVVTLGKIFDAPDEQPPSLTGGVVSIGKMFVAAPDGRRLVISDDKALLARALDSTDENAAYHFASDAIYEPVVEAAGVPMLTGANLVGVFQKPSLSVLRRAAGALTFDAGGITIDGTAYLETSSFRVLDALMRAAPPPRAWADELGAGTAGAATLRDDALSDYIEALARARRLGEFMRERYAGVLDEFQRMPSLRQLTVAVTGYRAGLPDFAMLVEADPAAVDAMVTRVQSRVRQRRDRAILEGARAAGTSPKAEPFALFDKYASADGRIGEANLSPPDFANAAYERRIADTTVRYLLPPVTANDLEFRPEFGGEAAPADPSSDRYRIATARVGDTHWFVTDASVLEERLLRPSGAPTFATTNAFRAASTGWTSVDRLQAFANMNRVLELAALNPETDLERGFLTYARELRLHPAITVAAMSKPGPARVRVRVRLDRRP